MSRGVLRGGVAVVAVAALVCALGVLSTSGRSVLLEYPMNVGAIGDPSLMSPNVQMAYGGMKALEEQVKEMGINVGDKPKHPKEDFVEAFGKMDALEKLVNGMEAKDFADSTSHSAETPDEALRSVMEPAEEDEEKEQPRQNAEEDPKHENEEDVVVQPPGDTAEEQNDDVEQHGDKMISPEEQDAGVEEAEKAALRQRGRVQKLWRRQSFSGFLPPYTARKERRVNAGLSPADKRRLALRSVMRARTGVREQADGLDASATQIVTPPWTR
jgi:hypothetical protein